MTQGKVGERGETRIEGAATRMQIVVESLKTAGQGHLIEALEALSPETRTPLLNRLSEIEWCELFNPAPTPALTEVAPSRVITLAERAERKDKLSSLGDEAYKRGTVAVLMVAGGQGTRLGLNAPKGCFGLGAASDKTIFEMQCDKVAAASRIAGHAVPFLIMTSPLNHEETISFFEANRYFGLTEDQVRFFSQSTAPSLDMNEQALLASENTLLENPDGHGGCFTALVKSGELTRLQKEGIQHIVYIQVDNVLSPVYDPFMIGAKISEQADMVTKVMDKVTPTEKVGCLVSVGGTDQVVEYTEISPEEAHAKDADGNFLYRWGSPAMHCVDVAFLMDLSERGITLPFHRSRKPLDAWTPEGRKKIDGWKMERFWFDLIPLAEKHIGLEIDRNDEFAPVKNASGDDSPESAKRLASDLARRWLAAAELEHSVPEGYLVEMSPLVAASCELFVKEFKGKADTLKRLIRLDDQKKVAAILPALELVRK